MIDIRHVVHEFLGLQPTGHQESQTLSWKQFVSKRFLLCTLVQASLALAAFTVVEPAGSQNHIRWFATKNTSVLPPSQQVKEK
jgi:hypothetical protein